MARIETVVKGDIIVERVGGKNRMIPVRKVELNACSKRSVHINSNACYDWGTHVRIAEGEGTLGDLEKEMSGLGDLEEDFDPGVRVKVGDVVHGPNPHLKHVHIPNALNEEELAELLVKH